MKKKTKVLKAFPQTPFYSKVFKGKWYVAVDENHHSVYFWDGKAKYFNFLYHFT
jgi:hypothetical protein